MKDKYSWTAVPPSAKWVLETTFSNISSNICVRAGLKKTLWNRNQFSRREKCDFWFQLNCVSWELEENEIVVSILYSGPIEIHFMVKSSPPFLWEFLLWGALMFGTLMLGTGIDLGPMNKLEMGLTHILHIIWHTFLFSPRPPCDVRSLTVQSINIWLRKIRNLFDNWSLASVNDRKSHGGLEEKKNVK